MVRRLKQTGPAFPSLANEVHDGERGGESMFSPRSSGSWPSCGCYFTHRNPPKKTLFKTEWNLPLIFSGTCHIGESRSRSGTLERPGGVTRGGVALDLQGRFTADGLCQGASAPVPGFPSAVFTSWQRGRALLTVAVRWLRRSAG